MHLIKKYSYILALLAGTSIFVLITQGVEKIWAVAIIAVPIVFSIALFESRWIIKVLLTIFLSVATAVSINLLEIWNPTGRPFFIVLLTISASITLSYLKEGFKSRWNSAIGSIVIGIFMTLALVNTDVIFQKIQGDLMSVTVALIFSSFYFLSFMVMHYLGSILGSIKARKLHPSIGKVHLENLISKLQKKGFEVSVVKVKRNKFFLEATKNKHTLVIAPMEEGFSLKNLDNERLVKGLILSNFKGIVEGRLKTQNLKKKVSPVFFSINTKGGFGFKKSLKLPDSYKKIDVHFAQNNLKYLNAIVAD